MDGETWHDGRPRTTFRDIPLAATYAAPFVDVYRRYPLPRETAAFEQDEEQEQRSKWCRHLSDHVEREHVPALRIL